MRLLVYTDYPYSRVGGRLYAKLAYSLLVAEVGRRVGSLILVGRLDPSPAGARYPVPEHAEFVPLPYYPSLARPLAALGRIPASLARFNRALAGADTVLLVGPNPLSVVFACAALLRRRRVFLGVRQDYPRYVRHRYPGKPLMWAAGWLLHAAYLGLARLAPVAAVGPAIAHQYRGAKRVHTMVSSLVSESEIVAPGEARRKSYDGPLTLLSVGRLDPEKNPLLLADVLARLKRDDSRWRLVVCGDGPLEEPLRRRLRELGLEGDAELRGYVVSREVLRGTYRAAHAFLHVSFTEALPRVLFEAFAAAVPTVGSDVGDVGTVGAGLLLVPPGDAAAAAAALQRIANVPELRRELVERGHEIVRRHTTEVESRRLASFIAAGPAA